MLAITCLSHLPGRELPRLYGPWVQALINLLGPFGDKWVHICMYFILGLSAFKPLPEKKLQQFLTCIVFGMIDETHQYFVPGRQFDLLDWAADSIGISLALVMVVLFLRLKKHPCSGKFKLLC